MEVLRSALMHDAEKIEEQPPLGGLYGPDGFFFQQRRGHLNLRSVASLNLDKLVREVDIDLLQIHIENITFCNLREEDLRYLTDPQIVKLFRIAQLMLEYLLYSQDKLVENLNSYAQKYAEKKKSLAKKRRELAELEESTKLLRNQVKAKKQNIATLEDLLREANRTREKELRKLKMKSGDVPEQRPAILHFFIAGPEGLCVEFTQKAETTIAQLHKEARKAFISRRDVDVSYDVDSVDLRLVFKGKLLLPDQTLEECEIREGDTIMAMLVERKRPEPVAPVQPTQAPPSSGMDTEAFAKQMFELMAKTNQEQLREVVQDINSGWKTALETIAANTKPTIIEHRGEGSNGVDPQLLASMQEHWHRAELQLAEKLQAMQEKQAQSDQELSTLAVLAARRRLRLGDLEDDDDERRPGQVQVPAPTPVVVNAPDNSLFVERIVRVEDKTMYTSQDVERMRAELDELKRLLAQKPVAPAPVAEPPKPKELKVAAVQQEAVVTRSNKWDTLPRTTPSAAKPVEPTKVKVETVVVEEVVPPAKPEPVVVQPEVKPKPPKPVPAPAPAPAPSPPTEVHLVFPAAYNPELATLLFSREDFVVTVPGSISLDDLLFEVRKAASSKTRTRFAKVRLEFRGKEVLLGSDMGEEAADWTAEHVAGFTRTGELRLLLSGNPLTDAQIDMLAPSWEKNKVFASSGANGPTTAAGLGRSSVERQGVSGGAAVNTRFKKRRSWDDDAAVVGGRDNIKGTPADVDDGFPPEEGTLPKGVYRKVRSSLEEALSEISDREGLTDSELELQRARLRETTEGLPTEVSDHLRNYKGTMAGALAAASTVDSGSDTGAGTNRNIDETFRSSVASLSGRDSGSVRTSRSLTLAARDDGQPFAPGLLRLSRAASPHSPGGASVVSASSNLRRSLEQFAAEEDLGEANMFDDAPMLASVNGSADFRRHSNALRFTPPASAAPSSTPTPREQASVGIAHAAPRNPHTGVVSAPPAASSDSSLMYSPSVSVAGTARTRYSAEEPENSDQDDSFVERRPQPKEAPPAKPLKTRWTKAVDRSEDEVSFNVTNSSAGDWAPAAAAAASPAPGTRPSSSPESDGDARAEAKTRRGDDGAALKGGSDSVDSFKREFRAAQDRQQAGAGAKADRSVADSTDRFRNTGDHTVMSSIRTLDDSVGTFSDHHAFLHEGGRGHGLGSTATTAASNVEDILSSTFESEGEVVAARPRADSSVGGGRRGSKTAVEHFGGLDEDASINSLALSDSNNLDEL